MTSQPSQSALDAETEAGIRDSRGRWDEIGDRPTRMAYLREFWPALLADIREEAIATAALADARPDAALREALLSAAVNYHEAARALRGVYDHHDTLEFERCPDVRCGEYRRALAAASPDSAPAGLDVERLRTAAQALLDASGRVGIGGSGYEVARFYRASHRLGAALHPDQVHPQYAHLLEPEAQPSPEARR